MRAKIGDVVIDRSYRKSGKLAVVVGEGINQPILIHHSQGIMMDRLGDYFSTWDGLEVIGHIDFEKVWAEAVRIADRKNESSSEKPNNCESKCCKCRWWSLEFGCQSKYKCEFEPLDKDTNVRSKPNDCKYAVNPSGDVWECGCCLEIFCEYQIYDRNPDGTLNIVECGFEPKTEPQTERSE